MAVTMAPFWIYLIISLIGADAAGEFSIIHSPGSLSFTGSNGVQESLLKEIFSASLGLSVDENSQWNGLLITDPFNTPEAIVEVYVDGISSLSKAAGLESKNYPLVVDEYEPDTFDAVKHRITQRFTDGSSKIENIRLTNIDQTGYNSLIFGHISAPKLSKQSLAHLKTSVEEDNRFLFELKVLDDISNKVKSGAIKPDNVVDFYSFRVSSLHALSDLHGPNSPQTKEAKKLLGAALEELSEAFAAAYDGSVLVTLVCTDVAHTRRAVRSLPKEADDVADDYSADYAAIFNIILWFSVVFTFTLIAIVYSLMDMDPGRDSIIYRMTSMRTKKDN